MKDFSKLFSALACLTQLGISAATPIVLSVFAAGWLRDRFALGNFVVIIGALIGIAAGYVCLFRLLKSLTSEQKNEKRKKD